MFLNVFILVRP